jgi:hypothetical protein
MASGLRIDPQLLCASKRRKAQTMWITGEHFHPIEVQKDKHGGFITLAIEV